MCPTQIDPLGESNCSVASTFEQIVMFNSFINIGSYVQLPSHSSKEIVGKKAVLAFGSFGTFFLSSPPFRKGFYPQTSLGTFAFCVAFCVALMWPSVISPSGVSHGLPMTTSFNSAVRESASNLVSFRARSLQHTIKAMLKQALEIAAAKSKNQKSGSSLACSHQLTGITGQLLTSKFSLAAKTDSAPYSVPTVNFNVADSTLPHAINA